MCLILFAWRAHAEYPLILAANRDEYFQRPATPAQFWADQPRILAGRDLEQLGTWLGMRTDGRVAALTNFRAPGERLEHAPSRGAIVHDFLGGNAAPDAYLGTLAGDASRYNGFNIIVADNTTMWHYSNRGGLPSPITSGVHGLSNHLINTSWPKVIRGKERLRDAISRPFDSDDLLSLLDDTSIVPDATLPDTGVGLERERQLSAVRIVGKGYGTRCSTVLVIRRNGAVEFVERSFNEDGSETGTVRFNFRLAETAATGA